MPETLERRASNAPWSCMAATQARLAGILYTDGRKSNYFLML